MKTKPQKHPETKVEPATLAEVMLRIEQALAQLTKGGLNEKAILVLLTHSTKLPQTTIKKVLQALRELKDDYGVK